VDRTAEADVADKWNRNADQWTNDVRSGYDTYRNLFT
jgi:2-polyprenyl-3-methyl-5-hydroxy-6-metoxy-1,4-benzoquinol methylase